MLALMLSYVCDFSLFTGNCICGLKVFFLHLFKYLVVIVKYIIDFKLYVFKH